MPKKEVKTAEKKEVAKSSKADIIAAVKEMTKASNLVVNNVRYETVKREEVVELLKKML